MCEMLAESLSVDYFMFLGFWLISSEEMSTKGEGGGETSDRR